MGFAGDIQCPDKSTKLPALISPHFEQGSTAEVKGFTQKYTDIRQKTLIENTHITNPVSNLEWMEFGFFLVEQ